MKKIYFLEAIANIKKSILYSTLFIISCLLLFNLTAEVAIQGFAAGYLKKAANVRRSNIFTQILIFPYTSAKPSQMSFDLNSRSPDEVLKIGEAIESIIYGLQDNFSALHGFCASSISPSPDHMNYGTLLRGYAVYPDTFKINETSIVFSEGKCFSMEDHIAERNLSAEWICPAVIGSDFANKFGLNLGDVFITDMFYTDEELNNADNSPGLIPQMKVVGILEKDSFFIRQHSDIVNLNNAVLFPDVIISTLKDVLKKSSGEITEDVISFVGETYFVLRNSDFYIRSDLSDEALSYINDIILSNDFLSSYYEARQTADTTVMIAENQKKAFDFFVVIVFAVYLFFLIGIILFVVNTTHTNYRNYAVHALNGATVYDLIMCSVTEISILLFVADVFFFMLPYRLFFYRIRMNTETYAGTNIIYIVLAFNLFSLLLSAAVAAVSLHKFGIVENLKQRE